MSIRSRVLGACSCVALSAIALSGAVSAPAFAQRNDRFRADVAGPIAEAARNDAASEAAAADSVILEPETRFQVQPGALATELSGVTFERFHNPSLLEVINLDNTIEILPPDFEPPTSVLMVGGQDADIEDWPAMASFRGRASSAFGSLSGQVIHYCGGSVIEPEWVLTAAHCVSQLVMEPNGAVSFAPFRPGNDGRIVHAGFGPMEIVLATDDLTDEGRYVVRNAVAVFVHPEYRPEIAGLRNASNDIALVRLDQPWEGELMWLSPTLTRDPPPTNVVWAAGFGALSGSPNDQIQPFTRAPSGTSAFAGSPHLQEAALEVVDATRCADSYIGHDAATQLCAGYDEGQIDSCTGDSGGPLVATLADGFRYQVGIVSFGYGCAQARYYGVYTRVSKFAPWIAQTIQAPPVVAEVSLTTPEQ